MKIPIVSPPWTGLGKKLESATRKALFDYEMVTGVEKIAVALSGGKDSLTLLYLLHAIKGKGFPDFSITAIHVSGEFSCGAGVDAGFLRAICDQLDVKLIIEHSTQKRETLSCYRCSRERRRLLFDAAKADGIHHIAFGHHQDDNAQTVLMNLLHKAEFAGNLPKIHMHDYDVTIIRPLIYISEYEVRNFAKQQGFARIMCQCPVGQTSLRRQTEDLLTELEHTYPNARVNLAKAALLYGSDKAKRK